MSGVACFGRGRELPQSESNCLSVMSIVVNLPKTALDSPDLKSINLTRFTKNRQVSKINMNAKISNKSQGLYKKKTNGSESSVTDFFFYALV